MDKIKVLIADDHTLVRIGLKMLVSAQPDLEFVGEAEDGEAAVAAVNEKHPDVVVMDLQMPVLDGVGATERIRREHPETQVVILTSFCTSDGISHALDKGAIGAILKNETETTLIQAIHFAAAGRTYIAEAIQDQIAADPPVKDLSPRQLEIISAMTRGLSNAEIAKLIGIDATTVRNHIVALFQKLGAANRAEAITIALRKHLLKD